MYGEILFLELLNVLAGPLFCLKNQLAEQRVAMAIRCQSMNLAQLKRSAMTLNRVGHGLLDAMF